MSLFTIILIVSAIDYIRNGHFTLVEWLRGNRHARRKPKYRDSAVQARVDRAKAGTGRRYETETGTTSGDLDAGHWARKGHSEDAALQHAILEDWKRHDVARMLRQTTSRRRRLALAAELGLDDSLLPAVYEWLAAVSWFYMSERPYDVRKSMGMELGTDFLPVSCTGAGKGDVIVEYPDCAVLIEASLMNLNNQRRNEWEPAMRHTADVSADLGKPVYTLFLAPKLDENTINVWRAVSKVPMSSRYGGQVRCRILPVTSDELADWVERGVSSRQVLDAIDRTYADDVASDFDPNWRSEAFASI